MSTNSFLPFIACSSCGSFVGHKYLHHLENIENGISEIQSFECLDIPSYCCRMLLTNPIVMSTNYGKEEKVEKEKKESKDDEVITFASEGNYFCNLSKGPLLHVESRPKENLVTSINIALGQKRVYQPPKKKILDLSTLDESSDKINVGDKLYISKIHKIYAAFEYE